MRCSRPAPPAAFPPPAPPASAAAVPGSAGGSGPTRAALENLRARRIDAPTLETVRRLVLVEPACAGGGAPSMEELGWVGKLGLRPWSVVEQMASETRGGEEGGSS